MRNVTMGCAAVLLGVGAWSAAHAQAGKDAKPAAAAEVRYFAGLGDLLGDLPVDAFIRETRQGGKLVAAVLDVCYSPSMASERKDRFVLDLKVEGEKLSGSGQSTEAKTPVSVSLIRKQAGKAFSFDGRITLGGNVVSVSSPDNADMDESEFQESQVAEDDLVEAPKDFTQVSPQSVAVKVKREAFVDLVKGLRGRNVQVALDSVATDCNALRSGRQVLRLIVDPARAPGLVAELKAAPGVAAAGWTSGSYDMERAVRFTAGGWSDNGRLDRDKFAAAVAAVAARVFGAAPAASAWNDTTGELTFTLKRPSALLPALNLTETLEITALVAPEKPGGSDRLVAWIGVPSSKTTDDAAGPRLQFAESGGGEDEGTFNDDDGLIRALAAELKGQRWDTDKASWK
jgi:hypothetical protein